MVIGTPGAYDLIIINECEKYELYGGANALGELLGGHANPLLDYAINGHFYSYEQALLETGAEEIHVLVKTMIEERDE